MTLKVVFALNPYKIGQNKATYDHTYIQNSRCATLERAARKIYFRKISGNVAEQECTRVALHST